VPIAEYEGFYAHADSVKVRLKKEWNFKIKIRKIIRFKNKIKS
jgi:hypothetical protein